MAESPEFRVFRPRERWSALGMAADYLSRKPSFNPLAFGDWTRTLAFQVGRDHQLFILDPAGTVVGYIGWALTSEPLAESWLAGRTALTDEQCRNGDCVIINAWVADSPAAGRFLRNVARELFGGLRLIYFKRFYGPGRVRPVRLTIREALRGRNAPI